MEKALSKIAAYCKRAKVEISIEPDGIFLWAAVSHANFTIGKVRPDEVQQKIAPILELRKAGWKTC